MNKRLITAITALLLIATGCAGDGNADDQFNRNVEKLAARIAEKRDRKVSVSVSPDLVMQELRKLSI